MDKTVLTQYYAHLKMAQVSVTGGEPAWVALAWVAAGSMIDTTISVIIGRPTDDVKDLGVLPVRAHMLSLDLHPLPQPLRAPNLAASLVETARRRTRGPPPLLLTASGISLQTRVVIALCSV